MIRFISIILNKRVQVFTCTLFLLICIGCNEQKKDQKSFLQIKTLSKFQEGETFKINNTIIIHSSDFLFKKNNKDSIWIPTTKYAYIKSPKDENDKLYDFMNNTGIMTYLADELKKHKVCKIINYYTITTQGFITIGEKIKLEADKEYLNKINN